MNQKSKIALGGGGYCLYAPCFPQYQLTPGFADECLIFNVPMPRMFVLSVLEDGLPIELTPAKHAVDNGVLTVEYATATKGVKITEQRMVTADDRFVSTLTIDNGTKTDREYHVVMWTTTDVQGEPVSFEGDSFRIRRQIADGDGPQIPTEVVYSNPDSKGAKCLQGYFAEGNSGRPDFEETPWFDRADLTTPKAKKPMVKPSPILESAFCYAGLFRAVKLKGGASVEHRFEANVVFKGKGINYRPRRPDPKDENGFLAFMEKAPRFTCEDKNIEKLVHHRLMALHLLRVPNGVGNIGHPTVCEGSGPLHSPSAFAAPAIMREARWLSDPTLARGVVKSFFDNVRQNGMVPSRLFMTALSNTDFLHADWGGGFEALDDVHNDRATKRAVLKSMERYSKWLDNNRDPEGSGLTDCVNHFECGQELSRRYTIIDDKADRADEASEQFRLKAIDASVFRYKLVKFLERIADEAQEKAMANRFIAARENMVEVIRKRMWDDKSGLFVDIDPKTRRKTGVKAAVGFYPLGTDIPTPKQVDTMLATLGDKKEFWTTYPVPSLAISDPFFDPDAQWKDTRRNAPWNGRVWPLVNSHVMEGLAYVAERGNKQASKLLKELFQKTMTMCSGALENLEEPRVFEHYHPENGRPSRYRGVDWVLQSFLMDNVFRVACGFVVRFGEIQDDPVIDSMPDFKLHGVPVGNKRFNVERKNGRLKVNPE